MSRFMASLLAGCFLLLPLEAKAATVSITGVTFTTMPPYGGVAVPNNNVVNSGSSKLNDTTPDDRSEWQVQSSSVAGVVKSTVNGIVDWYYVGAESGDTIRFNSGAATFTENNQNNNLAGSPIYARVLTSFGSTSILANTAINFSLFDAQQNSILTNGANNAPGGVGGTAIASLMFSYVNPVLDTTGALIGWVLTNHASDWFAFGYDDPRLDQ